jgi:hypothetical protein
MRLILGCMIVGLGALAVQAKEPAKVELGSVQKKWDKGLHNAFTGLVRFHERWYCVFREGKSHVSPDGAIRALTSADGTKWESAALIRSATADPRDPKITIVPTADCNCAAGALHRPEGFSHQSLVWFSKDGRDWGKPVEVVDPDYWLWRITWYKKLPTASATGAGRRRPCGFTRARMRGSSRPW